MENLNAKQFPKTYYARHMQAGICGYENEKILIESDQMKEMAPSFVGKPIYINHQKVDLPNLKEQAAGYISDSFYNELDGWLWVKFVVIDDDAHEVIQRGWAVSNAYIPTLWEAKGGTWHNVPYARQIMRAEFTHLAIVDNPRYEGACIFTPDGFKSYQAEKKMKLNELTNNKEPKKMFSLFKNSRTPVTADKIDAETLVDLGEGKSVSVQEMVNAVTAAEKTNADDEAKKKTDDEKMNSEITVGDDKMTVKELVSKYNAAMKNAKKNEVEKEEPSKEKEKENEDDKEKAKEEEKSNSAPTVAELTARLAALEGVKDKLAGEKSFDELKNAHLKAVKTPKVEIGADKTARGKARYGSNA